MGYTIQVENALSVRLKSIAILVKYKTKIIKLFRGQENVLFAWTKIKLRTMEFVKLLLSVLEDIGIIEFLETVMFAQSQCSAAVAYKIWVNWLV